MYHRPGQLFKDFFVEAKGTALSPRGRAASRYNQQDAGRLKAVLAQAKPEEKDRWHQLGHPISHTLTQRGAPMAKVADRLVRGKRRFYVQGVDNVGELGFWTIYYVEERFDTDGG